MFPNNGLDTGIAYGVSFGFWNGHILGDLSLERTSNVRTESGSIDTPFFCSNWSCNRRSQKFTATFQKSVKGMESYRVSSHGADVSADITKMGELKQVIDTGSLQWFYGFSSRMMNIGVSGVKYNFE